MRFQARHAAILAAALAAAAPAAIHAQTVQPGQPGACCQPPVQPTTLNLNVNANVKQAPDIATVSAGVVTNARTAKAAMDDNARRMTAAFAALKAAGIADRDLQTSGVNLAPQYDYQPNQRPRITGYQATNTVTVRVRRLDTLGPVLDALVAQGVNQINGPNFGLDQPEAALDKAREGAMKTAMDRAALYARASGMRVKRVFSINESGDYQPPPPMPMMMARAAMAEQADSTPVAPGEVTLSIQLNVAFELEK
jgi:uncharacterized protein YggE